MFAYFLNGPQAKPKQINTFSKAVYGGQTGLVKINERRLKTAELGHR